MNFNTETTVWLALFGAVVLLCLLLAAYFSMKSAGRTATLRSELSTQHQLQQQSLLLLNQALQQAHYAIRGEVSEQARAGREDSAANFSRLNMGLQQPLEAQTLRVQALSEANERRLLEVRNVLESRLQSLQIDNAAKLEQMRATVDERLQTTLEARLGESFKLVTERLAQVHEGLGEMRHLAAGVGDLKKVLSNVKTRGGWGEMQLAALLEQVLTHEQYAANVETVKGTGARVEFAIKLPGRSEGAPCWLPIDAKFPKEQYERLVDASDKADIEGVKTAQRELEKVLLNEARSIAAKYLSPPQTTDFAVLFLPTEGLYAEVVRRPGLTDQLQRECRVTVAGPSTLMAILNSLHMGFRTLALEKRASDVWEVLGAVKTEFSKFGDSVSAVSKSLEMAKNNLDKLQTRSNVMNRALREVESLPADQVEKALTMGMPTLASNPASNPASSAAAVIAPLVLSADTRLAPSGTATPPAAAVSPTQGLL
jgi:DNA recombination protein RmuC